MPSAFGGLSAVLFVKQTEELGILQFSPDLILKAGCKLLIFRDEKREGGRKDAVPFSASTVEMKWLLWPKQ